VDIDVSHTCYSVRVYLYVLRVWYLHRLLGGNLYVRLIRTAVPRIVKLCFGVPCLFVCEEELYASLSPSPCENFGRDRVSSMTSL
jgi:hypothetical protein